MPTACRQTQQIERRKLLKLTGALATLSLAGLAAAAGMPKQAPRIHSPIPLGPPPEEMMGATIKLVGVGRTGLNAVEYMIEHGVQGVEFICIDSAAGDIRAAIDGTHMLFIAVGMDSGIDAGAASMIARIGREMGVILTVALVIRPLEWESDRPGANFERDLAELQTHVDSLLVLHGDKLPHLPGDNFTQDAVFARAYDVMMIAVSDMAGMINVQGHVDVDFEDVRSVMGQAGKALMGTAQASGPERARLAAEQAMVCPLLAGLDLAGAQNVLVMIAAASVSLKLSESKVALNSIRAHASPDAHIIFGTVYDDALGDEIRITVVATGLRAPDSNSAEVTI